MTDLASEVHAARSNFWSMNQQAAVAIEKTKRVVFNTWMLKQFGDLEATHDGIALINEAVVCYRGMQAIADVLQEKAMDAAVHSLYLAIRAAIPHPHPLTRSVA